MANPFVHIELNSPDPQKAKAFYGKLFQWRFEDMSNPAVPDQAYSTIKVEEGPGGGIMKQVPQGPAGWIPYVQVDDLRTTTEKAKSLGAKVMKDTTEVPNMGSFSIIRDPAGSILGLWESNPKMTRTSAQKETASRKDASARAH